MPIASISRSFAQSRAQRCMLSSNIRASSGLRGGIGRGVGVGGGGAPRTTRSPPLPHVPLPTPQPRRSVHVERRLEALGIVLPTPPEPKANYNIVCHAPNNVLYVSGHLPIRPDGTVLTGKIGPPPEGPAVGGRSTRSLEHGYEAARHAGLNIVSTLRSVLGDLDRVEQIVKIFGIVQSTDDFHDQHRVMDGCSDVLMEVFGKPAGYHARSAIGTSALPMDISVEVEAIVQYKP